MSNQKLKAENYTNFGGINSKVSPHINTALEFLNIRNFDFQIPGSLTERWGSTQYVSQTFGNQITSLYEFSRLSGASYVLIGHTGGIWSGATTGNSQGLSLTNLTATLAQSYATVQYLQSAANVLGFVVSSNLYFNGIANSSKFFQTPGGTFTMSPAINGSNNIDFTTFQNYLFFADGQKFLKFDGITTTSVGMLPPIVVAAGATVNNAGAAATVGFGVATLGCFNFYASYVNQRGFEGPIWPVLFYDNAMNATTAPNAATLGGSFVQAWVDLYTPPGFGISAINVYSYFGMTLQGSQTAQSLWNPNYVFMQKYPAQGSTTRIPLGTTTGNFPLMLQNFGSLVDPSKNTYYPLGFTLINSATLINSPIQEISIGSFFPQYLEVYKNRMFCAGFSSSPSSVYFSELAEPEAYPAGNNFEVRTNDGDVITSMIAYYTRLYIFKRNSFYALYGDNPSNFYLQEISLAYGCLNNRSVVSYDDYLVFLDRNGLMRYNGSSLEVLSNKVQPFFDRMNYSAAVTGACVIRDKYRNQLHIAIPIDGSTVNNIIMVYDYLTNAWTTHDGYTPSVFSEILGRNQAKAVFYGTPSGTVSWFGSSFLSDNGVGFTGYFKTRFLHDLGDSVQKQWRRLYINSSASGATYLAPINFYQDYGSSKVLSTTMALSQFQNRIDFGVSAKAISFDFYVNQSSTRLSIDGFTIESRLQRRV